jgi:hypothetical protein
MLTSVLNHVALKTLCLVLLALGLAYATPTGAYASGAVPSVILTPMPVTHNTSNGHSLIIPASQLKALAASANWVLWFEKAPLAPVTATPLSLPFDLIWRQISSPTGPQTPSSLPQPGTSPR